MGERVSRASAVDICLLAQGFKVEQRSSVRAVRTYPQSHGRFLDDSAAVYPHESAHPEIRRSRQKRQVAMMTFGVDGVGTLT
jgi:hypothetical protein